MSVRCLDIRVLRPKMNHDSQFIIDMKTKQTLPSMKEAGPRERILDAARSAVALSGWRDAQIALIAHKAGVATGSVYRHFESKADLYANVLAMVSEKEVNIVRAIVESEGTAAQRLSDAIFMFSLRAMRGRQLAYSLIAEPCDPAIDTARLKYRAELAGQIKRLVEQGTEAGEFIEVDPSLAASCITGAFMEALVGPLAPEAEPNSADERELARSIAKVSTGMVLLHKPGRLKIVSKGKT